jgi:hypothetical protein
LYSIQRGIKYRFYKHSQVHQRNKPIYNLIYFGVSLSILDFLLHLFNRFFFLFFNQGIYNLSFDSNRLLICSNMLLYVVIRSVINIAFGILNTVNFIFLKIYALEFILKVSKEAGFWFL